MGGELIVSPRPASRHALASSAVAAAIGGPFGFGIGGPGGWVILNEPELHLRDDVVVPDLAGWRRERMPEFPDVPFFTLAPDWICEVLSPSTSRMDRGRKFDVYAREGVRHAWLVEPLAKVLEVFELREGFWVRLAAYTDDAVVRVPPFEALELPLGLLWPG